MNIIEQQSLSYLHNTSRVLGVILPHIEFHFKTECACTKILGITVEIRSQDNH